MPPIRKLEFPNGTPWQYKVMSGIVSCIFAANILLWYLIPTYWSVRIPDKAHPVALQFNGTVYHVSATSHWLFAGSFVVALIAVLPLVLLRLYYRLTGIAAPLDGG
jgi:hypothetical protein